MGHKSVVLDTETTGISPKQGHRIIEIGCVELIDRQLTGEQFQIYLQPDRAIDAGAQRVHGISEAFLKDKPRFAEIAEQFLDFIKGAELIIHNAPFDLGFLDAEFYRLDKSFGAVGDKYEVIDTLKMARDIHPGVKNNLDALCKRYHVDNSNRELHGALLDAQILSEVYLGMTGGQSNLDFANPKNVAKIDTESTTTLHSQVHQVTLDKEALCRHEAYLATLKERFDVEPVFSANQKPNDS